MAENDKNNSKPQKVEHTTSEQLQEFERKTEEQFQMFMFIIWEPNPRRGVVRVILDDGTIKLHMKYEKFLSVLESVLTSQDMSLDVYRNFQKIRLSLDEYQGVYYYDRVNNIYKRLSSIETIEKLKPKDIYEAERAKMLGNGDIFDATKGNSLMDEITSKNRKAYDAQNNKYSNIMYAQLKTHGGM